MRQQLAANIKTGAALTAALMLSACSVFQSAPVVAPPAPKPAPPPVEEPPALTAKMAAAQNDLTRMVAIQDRLYHVATPLLIDNADLCKAQARNLLGFTAKNKYSYPGDFSEAAQAVLGYGERLQVSGVLPGSGAAHAGLRKGDARYLQAFAVAEHRLRGLAEVARIRIFVLGGEAEQVARLRLAQVRVIDQQRRGDVIQTVLDGDHARQIVLGGGHFRGQRRRLLDRRRRGFGRGRRDHGRRLEDRTSGQHQRRGQRGTCLDIRCKLLAHPWRAFLVIGLAVWFS